MSVQQVKPKSTIKRRAINKVASFQKAVTGYLFTRPRSPVLGISVVSASALVQQKADIVLTQEPVLTLFSHVWH